MKFDMADWHADPLSQTQANQLLEQITSEHRQAVLSNRNLFYINLAEVVVRFSTKGGLTHELELLLKTEKDAKHYALLSLVYGQLLMSRKISGALSQLQTGLQLTSPYLTNAGYFRILKRHTILSYLPLHKQPFPPATLVQLVNEARVIRKLNPQKIHGHPKIIHSDTLS